ncbi:MAG: ATP-dependent DNA ligase [Candidatus Bathyarchaeia archaeon]
MTVVKPPTFRELVRRYGSVKVAVEHLIESGFTPEQIEWKWGVPYHQIRLFSLGTEPKQLPLFSSVVKVYERLAVLRSRKGKETELAKFFQRGDLSLERKTRLALGTLTEESLRTGPGIVERALCSATGAPIRKVRDLLLDYGEYGEVAFLLKERKEEELSVEEVYEAIRLLPTMAKIRERELHISSLLRVSTPEEAKYIVRLLLGDLKLGYYQQTVIRAAAKAYNVSPELIQGACAIIGLAEGIMLAPKGELTLSTIKLRPGQFLKPQLAHLYEPDKVEYPVRAEFKYDGNRLQIHKWGTRIQLFSRRAIEKSETLPEIVEIAGKFKAQSCIVDSELIAIDEKRHFLPFQALLSRTVPQKISEEELEEKMEKVGLTIQAFDMLFLNGRELTDQPLSERRRYLFDVVPREFLAEGRDCKDERELMNFYEEALKTGLEGIVIKDLDSTYEMGKRTYTWLKLKPERDTIDCTIIKALYGKGRRAGLYSSFLLAVRDPKEKRLYSIGKVSNLPEDTMETLRDIVEKTRTNHDNEGFFIKPSVMVEVTYQEIQETDEYTSGYALRVPKIVRFRPDKSIQEIDSTKKLYKLYEMQYERHVFKSL